MITIMNFIFANLKIITLAVWLVFFFIVVVRISRSAWVKNISYGWLVTGAVALHFLYGIIATWGQYRAWMAGSDITRMFFFASLPSETPLPAYIEWARPLFEHAHGYFIFYSFEHFFLGTIVLFIVTGLFFLFLFTRAWYRSTNFREGDILLIVLAMLISGWPGVIILLPTGLISAIALSVGARFFYGIERIPLSPIFLFAAPVMLIFANPILAAIHLHSLLKL